MISTFFSPIADIAEVELKIKAVEFVLGSFIDCESEEQRQIYLRQRLTEIPGLKTYVNYSENRLQDEKKQLQDLKILSMRKLEAETRQAPQTGKYCFPFCIHGSGSEFFPITLFSFIIPICIFPCVSDKLPIIGALLGGGSAGKELISGLIYLYVFYIFDRTYKC